VNPNPTYKKLTTALSTEISGRRGVVEFESHALSLRQRLALLFLAHSLLDSSNSICTERAIPASALPPVKSLLIAHGVAMTGWMALFLVQPPCSIASNNRRVHMSLGIVGRRAGCVYSRAWSLDFDRHCTSPAGHHSVGVLTAKHKHGIALQVS